ncbi:4'-phosphopantetheinyl transferase superfamily protein [Streptomyces sp. NPDC046261]|uniref:4'-phosphopantetheinyl transferase family protein n=1 Tax=Streptomyces sp. NPDC046261 TaxID=3157200 RepID=UPI00340C5E3F
MRLRVLGRDPLPGPWPAGGGSPHAWLLHIAADGARYRDDVLDARELARAAAFVRPLHRERFVAAHAGLRHLLGAYLGLDPAAVGLTRQPCPGCGGPHGRPAVAVAGEVPPLHFNLSHAGDLALFAFADAPVGADVEEVQPPSVAAEVARVLHPAEIAELDALPGAERPVAFARCWTRKEAYLKGTGRGLSENPSVTYVGTGPRPASPPGWTLCDTDAGPGYAAAVALSTG